MNNFEEKKEALERIVKDLVSVTNIYPLTRVIYDMKNYAEKRNRINSGKDIPDDLAFQKEILEKLNEKANFYILGGNSYLNVRRGIFSQSDILEKVISLVEESNYSTFIILVEDYSHIIGQEKYIELIETDDKPVIAISLKGAV